jgi:hypothetical protein
MIYRILVVDKGTIRNIVYNTGQTDKQAGKNTKSMKI